jgi:hypothetical protein
MFTKVVVGALLALGAHSAIADATIPNKDIAGANDSPLIKRYEGSFIVSYERESFTDFKVPLSPLEPTDGRDGMNNKRHLPKKEIELEGAKTRLAYIIPAERSPLEVLRNYEDDNIDLSRRRADSVVKALAANHGVDAKRMRGAGVGMLAPAASNGTEEGRAKNRRVEIVKLN